MTTTILKKESEIEDEVHIKEEELETDVVEVPVQVFEAVVVPVHPFEAEDVEVESEAADMKEEPCLDSESCSGSQELMLVAKQPLCVVSKTTTLAKLSAKQVVMETACMLKRKIPVAVTERMYSIKHQKAPRRTPQKTGKDEHIVKRNTTDFVLLTPGAKARQRRNHYNCRVCRKPITGKCKLCQECESYRAYEQLSKLYTRPGLKQMELYLSKHSKDAETKTQTRGETSHHPYPAIHECYVRLERSEAAEEALRLGSTININISICRRDRSAIIHAKKPYHCKMCKTTVGSPNELCQACLKKNLKPFRGVLKARLVKKIDLLKVNLSKFGNLSYVGEKPDSCEVCKRNVDRDHRFCHACERERARKQLCTILKMK